MTRETVFILKVVPKDFWGGKKTKSSFMTFSFWRSEWKMSQLSNFPSTDAYLPSKTSEFMFDSSCRVPYIRPVTKNTHPVSWLKVWQNNLELIHPKDLSSEFKFFGLRCSIFCWPSRQVIKLLCISSTQKVAWSF